MIFYENIIIGAGPASLQCAYFFKKYNINYLIIERNDKCGSFFDKYPHGGNLISINKVNTGNENEDFNLRHDWNSLLNDENFLFKDYSDKFYPDKESLVNYLNDFYKKFDLNIVFNNNVTSIVKEYDQYIINIENNIKYVCNKLIIATGLSKPNIPNYIINVKDKIKHYYDYEKNYFLNKNNLEEFKNKNVLILGGGNSSYELANIINEVSSSIFIVGKNIRNWSITSHYAGDLRTIYIPFLDTFLLKSLNAIDYNEILNEYNLVIEQENTNEKYKISINIDDLPNIKKVDMIENGRNLYDKIILCTGWKFDTSIFNFNLDMTLNNKYPNIKTNFESINNNNLFFIGSLMHSLDYRKSSGGFIHGFRYMIKSFINMNYNIPFISNKIKFETIEDCNILVDIIYRRINTSSDIYQMFGYFSDIMYYNIKEKEIYYYINIPININLQNSINDILNNNNINNEDNIDNIYFQLTLEYGDKVTDILNIGRKVSNIGTESKSTLIHPVLKIFNSNNNTIIDIIHFDEDLFAEFYDSNKYLNKFFRILKSYL
jgi:hypothetical protein